jgi:hypothetical protein
VSVQAVHGHVDLPALEPFDVQVVAEAVIQDLIPLLEPLQVLRLFSPESVRVLNGPFVQFLVLCQALDVSLGAEFLAGRKGPLLLHHAGDGFLIFCHG